jgi:hypothetical protein
MRCVLQRAQIAGGHPTRWQCKSLRAIFGALALWHGTRSKTAVLIAIANCQGRVSPVFDVAARLVAVRLEGGTTVGGHELVLVEPRPDEQTGQHRHSERRREKLWQTQSHARMKLAITSQGHW